LIHSQQLETEALGRAVPTYKKYTTAPQWRTTDGIKHPVTTKTLTAEELAQTF